MSQHKAVTEWVYGVCRGDLLHVRGILPCYACGGPLACVPYAAVCRHALIWAYDNEQYDPLKLPPGLIYRCSSSMFKLVLKRVHGCFHTRSTILYPLRRSESSLCSVHNDPELNYSLWHRHRQTKKLDFSTCPRKYFLFVLVHILLDQLTQPPCFYSMCFIR